MRLEDLPLDAQRRVLAKLRADRKDHFRKYHNEPDTRGVIAFDSKKEARRFDELMALLQAGEIYDLRLQPQFTLQEAYTTTSGKRVRAIRYNADFSYRRGDALVVEDVKSEATKKTPQYRMKRKMMHDRFGIEIQEVE